ncbi:MAG: diguanylate cyclase [Gammaproteobacteria bacterium]|nr:diguanylate cyclase [Gammaproteobacteria bacterium]
MTPELPAEGRELDALLKALRDGILVVNSEGEVAYANGAACALLGRSEHEIRGLSFGFPISGEGDTDITIVRPDGVPRILEMRANPLEWRQEPVQLVVLRDVTDQRRMTEELHRLARRDGLTGLYNHVSFYSILKNEIARSNRNKGDLSLLLLDIDCFKRFNDAFGHRAGDAVLRDIAQRICEEVREIDSVCRYGGEEFTAILPGTDIRGAVAVGERIRERIQAQPFPAGGDRSVPVTVSLGAASLWADESTAEKLVERADAALYRAKNLGRNRLVIADEQGQSVHEGAGIPSV